MSDSKKINLLVIPDLFPKSKEDVQGIFVLDYLKAVEPYCHITVLFVRLSGLEKGLVTELQGHATIHRYSLSGKKIPAYLKPLYYVRWFIKGYQVGKSIKGMHLIHAHGTILSGTLSGLLAKQKKIPFIITEHQGPFSMISASSWKRHWAKRTMEKADAVLTVSDHLKQEIIGSGIHPKRVDVTYNPVDTTLFALRENKATHNMLFAGRLDNFKGGLRCVQAFALAADELPGWTLTIVGDGEDMPAIKAFIKAHESISHRIVLKGHMLKAQIAREMASADFFVFPSRHESFGLVIAEAMSCGLPVIVGNLTAPKEYVDAHSGILVAPDDVEAIAVAMKQMAKNLSSYEAAAIRGRVVARFGFENFGKKLESIYRSLL